MACSHLVLLKFNSDSLFFLLARQRAQTGTQFPITSSLSVFYMSFLCKPQAVLCALVSFDHVITDKHALLLFPGDTVVSRRSAWYKSSDALGLRRHTHWPVTDCLMHVDTNTSKHTVLYIPRVICSDVFVTLQMILYIITNISFVFCASLCQWCMWFLCCGVLCHCGLRFVSVCVWVAQWAFKYRDIYSLLICLIFSRLDISWLVCVSEVTESIQN